MSTIHAASALDALSRLANLALSARGNLNHAFVRSETATAIDFVLYCERVASGKRQVREMITVSGYDHATHTFTTECIYRAPNHPPYHSPNPGGFVSFAEAMEAEVTREAAESEILRHHLDPVDFFREVGERPWYTGSEMLEWLGY